MADSKQENRSEQHPKPDKDYHTNINETLRKIDSPPSGAGEREEEEGGRGKKKRGWAKARRQVPVDLIEEEGMESFPASDPPGHLRSHTHPEKPEPRRPGEEDV
ncbi:MAG: hypothetical protein FWD61_03065 [Phycisphaerales bacterium]|nr:hypothetical protein [Phycisphaerales bacterium]